jgi:hypothetical protein
MYQCGCSHDLNLLLTDGSPAATVFRRQTRYPGSDMLQFSQSFPSQLHTLKVRLDGSPIDFRAFSLRKASRCNWFSWMETWVLRRKFYL